MGSLHTTTPTSRRKSRHEGHVARYPHILGVVSCNLEVEGTKKNKMGNEFWPKGRCGSPCP